MYVYTVLYSYYIFFVNIYYFNIICPRNSNKQINPITWNFYGLDKYFTIICTNYYFLQTIFQISFDSNCNVYYTEHHTEFFYRNKLFIIACKSNASTIYGTLFNEWSHIILYWLNFLNNNIKIFVKKTFKNIHFYLGKNGFKT